MFIQSTIFFQKSFSDLNQSLVAEECSKAQEIISPPKKLRAELPNDRPNDQPIVSPSWYTIVLNFKRENLREREGEWGGGEQEREFPQGKRERNREKERNS